MKKLLLLAVLTFGMVSVSNAQKKEKKVVELQRKEVSKSRGENPNIKNDVSFCDIKDVAAAEPKKSRGDYCSVDVGNHTGYYVKIYIDGTYYGMVSPYNRGSVTVYSGYTTIYCITAGGSYDWSAAGNCNGYYSYEIY